ncbi:MAG: MFS transporter [Dehalococcoidia bacterium]|nr:MFS transporter [Dehalococcoidia bacterium]MCA9825235.1 MFS transporter [Dehalococcoidia bacterium]MCA9844878.1 MFS transporter [Dehalococcoidia bacterium]MCA9853736.1 MFS transporter [Dehalococcoidia bacterium]
MSEAEVTIPAAATAAMPGEEAAAGTRNPFTSPRYRQWLTASIISAGGVGITNVTVPLFIRDRVSEDLRAIAIAAALISLTLPGALLTLVGGTFADRIERRRILVRTYSVAAMVSVAYVLLSAFDAGFIWPVFFLSAIVGACNAFGQPARQSMLPHIVSRTQLQNGVIFGMMGFMAMLQFLGPTIGGLLADLAGLTTAFSVEVVLLFIAAFVFSRIVTEQPPPTGRSVLNDLVGGLRYVRSHTAILGLLCLGAIPGIFFIGPFAVTIPLVVPDILERSDKWVGILAGCFGAGVVIGSIILAIRPIPRRGLAILYSCVAGGAVLVVYGLSDALLLSMATLFVWGLGASVFINYAATLIQENTDPAVMGRVMSMYFLSFQLSLPIGYALSGVLVSVFGIREALIGNGVVAIVIGALCLIFLREVRAIR